MATIRPRKRADGTISYTAQIRIKKNGVQVYTQSQTFARKKAAEAVRVATQTHVELAGHGLPPPAAVNAEPVLPTQRRLLGDH